MINKSYFSSQDLTIAVQSAWGQFSHVTRTQKLKKILLRLIYDKSEYSSSKILFIIYRLVKLFDSYVV